MKDWQCLVSRKRAENFQSTTVCPEGLKTQDLSLLVRAKASEKGIKCDQRTVPTLTGENKQIMSIMNPVKKHCIPR